MPIQRRAFIQTAAAGAAALALTPWLAHAKSAPLRIGSCSLSLEEAKRAGLQGIQLPVQKPAETLEIADPAYRAKFKAQMQETGLAISSLMMGLFNGNPLASDPHGPAWLEQCIDAAKDLGAKSILVAFFGKGNLLDENNQVKQADVDVVVQRLKAAAPRAKDAGVVLGIENYLSAQDNVRILDRINSDAVQSYYDCFNVGATKGYDVPAELRLLKGRITEIHFKNGPAYLENGQLKFEPIAAAIKEIGYDRWIVLETSAPSKDKVADAAKNAAYIRKLGL